MTGRMKPPSTNETLKDRILENISKVIIGKGEAMELLLVALFAEGHVLIEDVPGVGKTLLTKSLARSIDGTFKRVQCTPDLLPGDITGFNVYDQRSGDFVFHPGPVHTHILLVDEINRAIPRTQSSLLESMGEQQVTIDSMSYPLPHPFIVLATQNPIELEGTFPLPEAQLDRFLMKIHLGYPDREEESEILLRYKKDDPLDTLEAVTSPEEILRLQELRGEVTMSEVEKDYILEITSYTRNHSRIKYGASPRGSLGLMHAAQSRAVLHGRDYIHPDDVKRLAVPVLSHRVVLEDEELISGVRAEALIGEIVERLAVPV